MSLFSVLYSVWWEVFVLSFELHGFDRFLWQPLCLKRFNTISHPKKKKRKRERLALYSNLKMCLRSSARSLSKVSCHHTLLISGNTVGAFKRSERNCSLSPPVRSACECEALWLYWQSYCRLFGNKSRHKSSRKVALKHVSQYFLIMKHVAWVLYSYS